MRDTLPEAELIRLAAIRRLDPQERLRQALEMSDLVRRLARAGHPTAPVSGSAADAGDAAAESTAADARRMSRGTHRP